MDVTDHSLVPISLAATHFDVYLLPGFLLSRRILVLVVACIALLI